MRFSWGGSCVSRCTLAASVRQLSRCPRVEPAAQAPAKQWYGWQLLLADGTTVAATLLSQSGEVLLAGYLALPPTVAPPSTPLRTAWNYGLVTVRLNRTLPSSS